MTEEQLEQEVAQIVDPTAYCVEPGAYGLANEKEMLERTLVGPIRSIALERARRIIKLVRRS